MLRRSSLISSKPYWGKIMISDSVKIDCSIPGKHLWLPFRGRCRLQSGDDAVRGFGYFGFLGSLSSRQRTIFFHQSTGSGPMYTMGCQARCSHRHRVSAEEQTPVASPERRLVWGCLGHLLGDSEFAGAKTQGFPTRRSDHKR